MIKTNTKAACNISTVDGQLKHNSNLCLKSHMNLISSILKIPKHRPNAASIVKATLGNMSTARSKYKCTDGRTECAKRQTCYRRYEVLSCFILPATSSTAPKHHHFPVHCCAHVLCGVQRLGAVLVPCPAKTRRTKEQVQRNPLWVSGTTLRGWSFFYRRDFIVDAKKYPAAFSFTLTLLPPTYGICHTPVDKTTSARMLQLHLFCGAVLYEYQGSYEYPRSYDTDFRIVPR